MTQKCLYVSLTILSLQCNGLVQFDNERTKNQAIRLLHRTMFHGKEIQVQHSKFPLIPDPPTAETNKSHIAATAHPIPTTTAPPTESAPILPVTTSEGSTTDVATVKPEAVTDKPKK